MFCQNQKIQKTFIKFVCNLFRISTGDMIVQVGEERLELFYDSDQISDLAGLCKSKVEFITCDIV